MNKVSTARFCPMSAKAKANDNDTKKLSPPLNEETKRVLSPRI